ncbi:MAG: NYN domain-containing protein [Clostridia bacterium]|nr:NYN domain-containing protein [Clostridia bacterium]
MYIFWDNSNIHISGLEQVRPIVEPEAPRELYRTHFENLFKLVKRDRIVDCAYLSGSVPPPNDQLWDYLTRLNIKLQLLNKTADGKEQESVDMSLQAMMLRTAIDFPPSTMAIITGDGAGKQLGEGFLTDIKRIKEKFGWEIELYAWDASCNMKLKQYIIENGSYTRLEDYYDSITFIQKDRKGSEPYYRAVKPLT